ncbi:uncharacterized protein I303_106518 [Kwoniella dejecticola CBS 10117]|uniref:Uncharacterized protein n=1 Tax=Kwoniella dejecticola CBS 10117 TaxID=1296121 RepID=A0A1A5ZUH0_9TREE|nr:uncharacterized protein I303_08224 [Kwoniella dejecticola CBS 10117]OBR81454.1 hypothetical protein I303_08224 [Kwoniella dejecticola CBS 10117]
MPLETIQETPASRSSMATRWRFSPSRISNHTCPCTSTHRPLDPKRNPEDVSQINLKRFYKIWTRTIHIEVPPEVVESVRHILQVTGQNRGDGLLHMASRQFTDGRKGFSILFLMPSEGENVGHEWIAEMSVRLKGGSNMKSTSISNLSIENVGFRLASDWTDWILNQPYHWTPTRISSPPAPHSSEACVVVADLDKKGVLDEVVNEVLQLARGRALQVDRGRLMIVILKETNKLVLKRSSDRRKVVRFSWGMVYRRTRDKKVEAISIKLDTSISAPATAPATDTSANTNADERVNDPGCEEVEIVMTIRNKMILNVVVRYEGEEPFVHSYRDDIPPPVWTK